MGWDRPKMPAEAKKPSMEPSAVARRNTGTWHLLANLEQGWIWRSKSHGDGQPLTCSWGAHPRGV